MLFERIVARLEAAEPGQWVLKGGMALEVRLQDDARLTKDIDLGLRAEFDDERELHERVADALALDLDGDNFVLSTTPPRQLSPDGGGHVTWRISVAASVAGKPFGGIKLDVSPRAHELEATDRLPLPNLLDFAEVPAPEVEIIDVQRHAAEKLHAMARDYGDRDNSRVRDLVDIVLLIEHDALETVQVAAAARDVWQERDAASPPPQLPPLPNDWPQRYEQLATEHELQTTSFDDALALVERLWSQMIQNEET